LCYDYDYDYYYYFVVTSNIQIGLFTHRQRHRGKEERNNNIIIKKRQGWGESKTKLLNVKSLSKGKARVGKVELTADEKFNHLQCLICCVLWTVWLRLRLSWGCTLLRLSVYPFVCCSTFCNAKRVRTQPLKWHNCLAGFARGFQTATAERKKNSFPESSGHNFRRRVYGEQK